MNVNEDVVEPSQNPSVIEDLAKDIRSARAKWENTVMTDRPPLPRITVNRKVELLIKQTNQAIQLKRHPSSITSTGYYM